MCQSWAKMSKFILLSLRLLLCVVVCCWAFLCVVVCCCLLEGSPYAGVNFMDRRPTLCTLHIAVDFLKSRKIAVVWGGGVLLGYRAYIISL